MHRASGNKRYPAVSRIPHGHIQADHTDAMSPELLSGVFSVRGRRKSLHLQARAKSDATDLPAACFSMHSISADWFRVYRPPSEDTGR